MAVKYCICAICNEKFDRNSIQAVKHGARRYAHQTCFPEGELVPMEVKAEDDPDYQALIGYIAKIFGNNCNWAMTKKYIKKFKEENKYSYSGMLKSLVYFYEVKKSPVDKANGSIGIIPFIYNDAYQYYYNLFMAQQNVQKNEYKYEEKERVIKPPKSRGIFKKLFKLQEVDENEE